jgi:hypothetical protein
VAIVDGVNILLFMTCLASTKCHEVAVDRRQRTVRAGRFHVRWRVNFTRMRMIVATANVLMSFWIASSRIA